MHKRNMVMVLLVCALLIQLVPAQAALKIYVNKSVPVEEISRSELKNIYVGNMSKWPNGDKIFPITMKDKAVHGTFTEEFLNMSVNDYNLISARIVFSGKGVPPEAVGSKSDVIKALSGKKGAIAYADSDITNDDIKELKVK